MYLSSKIIHENIFLARYNCRGKTLKERNVTQDAKTKPTGLLVGQGSDNWPVTLSTTGVIVKSLFRCRNFVWENDHKIVDQFGLTWGQFETLVALRFAGSPYQLSPTQLYDAVQVSSGGLTKILIGLEKMGLVDRVDDPDDRRSRFVCLLPKGKDQIETLVDQLAQINGAFFSKAMALDESEELARLLGKLVSALEQRDSNSRYPSVIRASQICEGTGTTIPSKP
jgi:DNA-binding MarR family transcriptional regulator